MGAKHRWRRRIKRRPEEDDHPAGAGPWGTDAQEAAPAADGASEENPAGAAPWEAEAQEASPAVADGASEDCPVWAAP